VYSATTKATCGMKVFFDCEFTGLHQHTTLISIGLVSEDGRTFYAEANDYNKGQITDWLRNNVLTHLQFSQNANESLPRIDLEHHAMKGTRSQVAFSVAQWLAQWELVEMWGDCLAYDWVLFCQLWGGGAECLPKNVSYIPFDLATLLAVAGVDPDVSRTEYAGFSIPSEALPRHNALFDAKVLRACYERVMASGAWSSDKG